VGPLGPYHFLGRLLGCLIYSLDIFYFKPCAEVRDLFRKWREENVRKSREVVDLWESTLKQNIHKLGDEGEKGIH